MPWRASLRPLLITLGLVVAHGGFAADASDGRALHFSAERVVVFGDVHGAYQRLVGLLRASGVVDAELRWVAGTTHLVSLGDLLDRGPGARPTLDLLMRLQTEAAAAGGRVHVLLGNHELMNLLGDLRYVADSEVASFASAGAASPGSESIPSAAQSMDDETRKRGLAERHAAFAPDGYYGRWLLAQPTALIVNDTAFVHGGLPPAAARLSPAELDRAVKDRLAELLTLRTDLEQAGVIEPFGDIQVNAARLETERPQVPGRDAQVSRFIELADDELFGEGGVMWYRGTALCHDLLERPVLQAALDHWQVERVVVGHTPTWDGRVRERFGGRALLADTGMLEEVYHGQPAALVIEGDATRVLYPDADAALSVPDPRDGLEFDGLAQAMTERILAEGTLRAAASDAAGPALAASGADPEARDPSPATARTSPPRATLPPGTTLVEMRLGDARLTALFEPGARAGLDRQVAAYRLDRLLGLNLVAPVAVREFEGKTGLVSARWANTVDEQARAAARLNRENWCAAGSDFLLLYAFDALVRNVGRTPNTMLYDSRTWQLASAGHADTFGRGRDFPPYLANAPKVLPPALAARLRALDETTLTEALGALLSKAQVRALLARRDELLSTWTITQAPP